MRKILALVVGFLAGISLLPLNGAAASGLATPSLAESSAYEATTLMGRLDELLVDLHGQAARTALALNDAAQEQVDTLRRETGAGLELYNLTGSSGTSVGNAVAVQTPTQFTVAASELDGIHWTARTYDYSGTMLSSERIDVGSADAMSAALDLCSPGVGATVAAVSLVCLLDPSKAVCVAVTVGGASLAFYCYFAQAQTVGSGGGQITFDLVSCSATECRAEGKYVPNREPGEPAPTYARSNWIYRDAASGRYLSPSNFEEYVYLSRLNGFLLPTYAWKTRTTQTPYGCTAKLTNVYVNIEADAANQDIPPSACR